MTKVGVLCVPSVSAKAEQTDTVSKSMYLELNFMQALRRAS